MQCSRGQCRIVQHRPCVEAMRNPLTSLQNNIAKAVQYCIVMLYKVVHTPYEEAMRDPLTPQLPAPMVKMS